MDLLRESLRQFFLFVLAKGEPRFDSRAPNLLRAEIRAAASVLRGPGRSTVNLPVSVRNAGDTLWLHELNAIGGYVMLGGHIHSARGDRVVRGAFRTALPATVAPGESVELQRQRPAADGDGALRGRAGPCGRERGLVRPDGLGDDADRRRGGTARRSRRARRLAGAARDAADACVRRAGNPRDASGPRPQRRPAHLAGARRDLDRPPGRTPPGRHRGPAGPGLPAREPRARRGARRDDRAGGAIPCPARARGLPAQARHGARAGLLVRAARVGAARDRARGARRDARQRHAGLASRNARAARRQRPAFGTGGCSALLALQVRERRQHALAPRRARAGRPRGAGRASAGRRGSAARPRLPARSAAARCPARRAGRAAPRRAPARA